MYYEINVTLNGKHLFATAERSITNKWKLKEVYDIIKNKFPKEEGYDISVSKYETTGKSVDVEREEF